MGEAKKHFQPVGQCIYCGRKDALSDEHVIPLGLGGSLILPEASCPACADVTKKFEQHLLRGHWWAYRRKIGIKTRHPKQQPDTFPVVLEYPSGERVTKQISPAEYPFVMVCDFDAPSFLNGCYASGVPVGRVFLKPLMPWAEMPHVEKPDPRGTPKLIVQIDFDVADFVRLLCKIALSYAIGRRSIASFSDIFVKRIVLGDTDGALSYVGRASITGSAVAGAGNLHALSECTSGDLLLVYIVLFRAADENMPVYQVVVGRLHR